MAYEVDMRDIHFTLFEQMKVKEKILSLPAHSGFSEEDLKMILEEARKLAVEKIAPINKIGDTKGCRYENGTVKVPEEFHEAYKLYREGGWVGAFASPEYGGGGLPPVLAPAVGEIFIGACCALTTYPGLTSGAARLIERFGTEQMKKIYLKKMYEGIWAGTMVLTEPQAGSAVGDIKTIARKAGDHYLLEGTKIFITGGDQDLTENIIHLVLARTEGAPKGIKGLSLFLVPKFLVDDNGNIKERNDVHCTRIEEKMGLHGSATCQLSFGDNGKCVGYIIGKEGEGIQIMFHLMNEARLGVGIQSLAEAAAAYLEALNYAKERIQGVEVTQMKNVDAPRVPIIRHPDVKRMLMIMKAYVEGMRALLYYTGLHANLALSSPDGEVVERSKGLVDLLTPVCKAYCSDTAFEVTRLAIQVHGGYGYTKDYMVEQYMRDVKVNSIYEGTNGIQALDLLGRKVAMKGGILFMNFIQEMNSDLERKKETSSPLLSELLKEVERAKDALADVTMFLGSAGMSGDVFYPVLNATPYLQCFGDVVLGWLLLDQAYVAESALKKLTSDEGEKLREKAKEDLNIRFYYNKIKTAEFFIKDLMQRAFSTISAIKSNCRAVLEAELE